MDFRSNPLHSRRVVSWVLQESLHDFVRGNSDVVVGRINVFLERVSAGEEVTVNGKDFVTAAKLILKNSADATKTLDIEGAAFTATSVTFTVPADAEAGN